jgi:hypothetical protein
LSDPRHRFFCGLTQVAIAGQFEAEHHEWACTLQATNRGLLLPTLLSRSLSAFTIENARAPKSEGLSAKLVIWWRPDLARPLTER